MATKAPNPTDRHVGSRVRMRRMMLSMSQEKLGDALGLTFQQVQKYEKGTNRIGGSRMQQLSKILQVPVGFFFEEAQGLEAVNQSPEAPAGNGYPMALVDQFLGTSEGLATVRAMMRIPRAERMKFLTVLQAFASHYPEDEE